MGLPLDYHLHLCQPRLHELPESESTLGQLLLDDAVYEVVGFDDEYSVDVRDQLLEEYIAIRQSDLGLRLNQVGAALD